MKKLKNALMYLAWWDLLFIIPMLLLFVYLPAYNFISVLLNVVIVIFFSMGLILTTHILWNYFQK